MFGKPVDVKIELDDVPPKELREAEQALIKIGLPVSAENLRVLLVDGKKDGKF